LYGLGLGLRVGFDGEGKYVLAKMYEKAKDYDKALKLYEEGISTAQNDIKRIRDPPDYERLRSHVCGGY
jgi:tetratricopeptide (TPR) repeat protein